MKLSDNQGMESYFVERGWNIQFPSIIRGIKPDLVVEKNGKIAAIEIKGERADPENGIKQALHFKNAVNYAYLAIQKKMTSKKIEMVCNELGLGLIVIDKTIKEIVRPIETKALESVKRKILQTKRKTQMDKRRGSLQTLFRSNAFVDILNFLILNQSEEYGLNELARIIRISPSVTLRELNKIVLLKIVTKKYKNNLTFYRINKDCTIYEELKQIFSKFGFMDQIIATELKSQDIKYALIYGSVAKGTETEHSDIDLLIISNMNKQKIFDRISKIEEKIKKEIHVIIWNDQELDEKIKQKISLLHNINQNKIIMIKGDEYEFRRAIT